MGWVAKWLAHFTLKRDIMGLNPARVKTIFRLSVRLAYTRHALVEYKLDRAVLGDRQRHQVCMGDP